MEIRRWIQSRLTQRFQEPYVHILFGARQTGKTTLLHRLVDQPDLCYNLADPGERSRLLADPGTFRRECEAVPRSGRAVRVIVDEAQLVPEVFDSVQILYDRDPSAYRFFLCGSSARKLRQTGANLLPGRSLLHRLFPLTLVERPGPRATPFQIITEPEFHEQFESTLSCGNDLLQRMAFGDLPGIITAKPDVRTDLLKSYTTIYLQEEIRREAYVKDWGAFVNFLRLAAAESGQAVNYSKIARETGLSEPTVKSHYQLLEDMFVGFHVPACSGSVRGNLLSRPRFLFFDLGVRHAAAGLKPSLETVEANPGPFFEQWVGMELHRRIEYAGLGKLHYFRTRAGAEIDYIIEDGNELIPVEVKWTENPVAKHARQVHRFLQEVPKARKGFVVCQCPRPARLMENVTALPWWMI